MMANVTRYDCKLHRHHDHELHGRIGSFRVVTAPPAPEHPKGAQECHYGPTEGRESPLSTEDMGRSSAKASGAGGIEDV